MSCAMGPRSWDFPWGLVSESLEAGVRRGSSAGSSVSLSVMALPHGANHSPMGMAYRVHPSIYREEPEPNIISLENWERSLYLGQACDPVHIYPKSGHGVGWW